MTVDQQRVLKTAIPGPRSAELHARRTSAVASGVGTTLPVYVAAAGGGIVVDVDGNQLIDFGSGIAVTSVGNAAPRVVDAVQAQVAEFTHTCFMVTPYEEYVAVAEKLNELTPGHLRKAFGAVQLRRRGGRERGQDRAVRDRTPGRRRLRPRLSRPHQPDDGAHREEHAVQAPLRPVRRRDLPGADGLPVPLADRPGQLRGRGVRRVRVAGAHAGRRGRTAPPCWSNRSRARAGSSCRRRVSWRRCRSGAPNTGSSSSPTRSRPGSAAPATGSRASTRVSSPT